MEPAATTKESWWWLTETRTRRSRVQHAKKAWLSNPIDETWEKYEDAQAEFLAYQQATQPQTDKRLRGKAPKPPRQSQWRKTIRRPEKPPKAGRPEPPPWVPSGRDGTSETCVWVPTPLCWD